MSSHDDEVTTFKKLYKSEQTDKFGGRLVTFGMTMLALMIGLPVFCTVPVGAWFIWAIPLCVSSIPLTYFIGRTVTTYGALNEYRTKFNGANGDPKIHYLTALGAIMRLPITKTINCGNTMVTESLSNSHNTFNGLAQNTLILRGGKITFKQIPSSALMWERSFASTNAPLMIENRRGNRWN